MADQKVFSSQAERNEFIRENPGYVPGTVMTQTGTATFTATKQTKTATVRTSKGFQPITVTKRGEQISDETYWKYYGPGPEVPFTKENVEKYSDGKYTIAVVDSKRVVVEKTAIQEQTAVPEPTETGKVVVSPKEAYEGGLISEREMSQAIKMQQYVETTQSDIERAKLIRTQFEKEYPGMKVSPGGTPFGAYSRMKSQEEQIIGKIADEPLVRFGYVFHEDTVGFGTVSEAGVSLLTGQAGSWDEGKSLRTEYARKIYHAQDVVISPQPSKTQYLYQTAGVGLPQAPLVQTAPTKGTTIPAYVKEGLGASAKTGAVVGGFAVAGGVAGKTAQALGQTAINVVYGVELGGQIAKTIQEPSGEEIARTFVYSVPLILHAGVKTFPKVKETAITVGQELKVRGKQVIMGLEQRLPTPPQMLTTDVITFGPRGKTIRGTKPKTTTVIENDALAIYQRSQSFVVEITEPNVYVRTRTDKILRRPSRLVYEGQKYETLGSVRQTLYWEKVTGKARITQSAITMTEQSGSLDIRIPKPVQHDIRITAKSWDLSGPSKVPKSPGGPAPPPGDSLILGSKPEVKIGKEFTDVWNPKTKVVKTYRTEDILGKTGSGTGTVKSGSTQLLVRTKPKIEPKVEVGTKTVTGQIAKTNIAVIRTSLLSPKVGVKSALKTRQKSLMAVLVTPKLSSKSAMGQLEAQALAFTPSLTFRTAQRTRTVQGMPLVQLTAQASPTRQMPRSDLLTGGDFSFPKIAGGDLMGGGGGSALLGRRSLTGKKSKYKPSLGGIVSGVSIKKAPKNVLTGLEHRYPVISKKKLKGGLF